MITAWQRLRRGDWAWGAFLPGVVVPTVLLFAGRVFFSFVLRVHVLATVLVYGLGVFVGLVAVFRFFVWRPRPAWPKTAAGPFFSQIVGAEVSENVAVTALIARAAAERAGEPEGFSAEDRRRRPSNVHGATAAAASPGPDVTGVLGDYYDLVTTGYAVSVDDPAPDVLKAWFAGLEERTLRDGLTITCKSFYEPPHRLSFIGVAFLNLPDGERPPEDPNYYVPWGAGEQRRAALIGHLEADWGETLVTARARAEAELDAAIPGWHESHRRHD